MKKLLLLAFILGLFSIAQAQKDNRTQYFAKEEVNLKKLPKKKHVWVFIMAGQSNMAGRGQVEPQDTLLSKRIITINKAGELIYAKEPLHFYEPSMTGLDCGLSFGRALLNNIPANVTILLIPTAVGGSSISQWLGDSIHRNVRLLTNFKEKVSLARKYGRIKGILWHQGERDANPKDFSLYKDRLTALFAIFRETANNSTLPIIMGELGSYSKNADNWVKLNEQINLFSASDPNTAVVHTADFVHKGDFTHFNSDGQRMLGQRFAEAYMKYHK